MSTNGRAAAVLPNPFPKENGMDVSRDGTLPSHLFVGGLLMDSVYESTRRTNSDYEGVRD